MLLAPCYSGAFRSIPNIIYVHFTYNITPTVGTSDQRILNMWVYVRVADQTRSRDAKPFFLLHFACIVITTCRRICVRLFHKALPSSLSDNLGHSSRLCNRFKTSSVRLELWTTDGITSMNSGCPPVSIM